MARRDTGGTLVDGTLPLQVPLPVFLFHIWFPLSHSSDGQRQIRIKEDGHLRRNNGNDVGTIGEGIFKPPEHVDIITPIRDRDTNATTPTEN